MQHTKHFGDPKAINPSHHLLQLLAIAAAELAVEESLLEGFADSILILPFIMSTLIC
jgi:hypothetical protein